MSIRDSQVIDIRVPRTTPDEPDRLVSLFQGSEERIPLVVAFFGPNGAGKSTVLKALNFLFLFIAKSFEFGTTHPFEFAKFCDDVAPEESTFLSLSFTLPEPSEIDVPGATNNCHYRYEVEIGSISPALILRESLTYRRIGMRRFAKLITRNGSSVTLHNRATITSLSLLVDKILRPNASVISTLAQLNHTVSVALQSAAINITSNIGMIRHERTDESVFAFYQDPQVLLAFNRDVARLDVGIKQLQMEPNPSGWIATLEHEGLSQPIPITLESHGTRQFFRIFPYIEWALRHGTIGIIDELDASIHPMLLPEIVGWFNDPERNARHAQLWMTCHSTPLLEYLIKPEVFFCEKDTTGKTSVFGLRDIQAVRTIDNFHRKYLGGVYGAVPSVG